MSRPRLFEGLITSCPSRTCSLVRASDFASHVVAAAVFSARSDDEGRVVPRSERKPRGDGQSHADARCRTVVCCVDCIVHVTVVVNVWKRKVFDMPVFASYVTDPQYANISGKCNHVNQNGLEDSFRELNMSSSQLVDSCLLVNRKVEETTEVSVERMEHLERRVLHDRGIDMPPYHGEPEFQEMSSSSYSADVTYHPVSSNGHAEDQAVAGRPGSQVSHHSSSPSTSAGTELVSRTHKQHTTQQGEVTMKVIIFMVNVITVTVRQVGATNWDWDHDIPIPVPRPLLRPVRVEASHLHPPEEEEEVVDSPPSFASPLLVVTEDPSGAPGLSGYAELDTTFAPQGEEPFHNHEHLPDERFVSSEENGLDAPAPRAMFDDDDHPPLPLPHFPPPSPSITSDGRVRWRDPDLHEVIDFLLHPNNVVKANAAAYLQHLCYMDNPVKQKTRTLGGIPPLISLLSSETPEVHRNACGALRNLSYGRQNDENKKSIRNAGGIPALIRLLRRTHDNDVRELVTGTLWNLSSCEELKKPILDDAMTVLVSHIIIPYSGWDRNAPPPPHDEKGSRQDLYLSTVFRNSTGILRNASSAGEFARKQLRECEGLVDSLLYVVKSAIGKSNIDNKSVENCVCVLRNLSYRCQEVEDPNYDRNPPPGATRSSGTLTKGENPGCFGAQKKKEKGSGSSGFGLQRDISGPLKMPGQRSEPLRGMELLWQPEVVQPYLSLLSDCSNPETLEASAGAIQNLAACYWQASIDIRAAVRKEKGLPILVELLRMEVDRVVCAVATALRNLAIDERNKELIGKYAMRDLVQKLPSGNPQHDLGTSDDTIAAVLATLNEVVKKNAEFARLLYEAGGVDRLVNISRQRQKYNSRVIKFSGQVLYTMWQHQELREVYKRGGWKEQDFVTRTVAARNARPHSPSAQNSTLNRPMASQGGTRYEDRTLQRGANSNLSRSSHYTGEEVPLADVSYPDGDHPHLHSGPPGGVRSYPPATPKPGEPLYAQVNRDRKKNRQYDARMAAGPYDVNEGVVYNESNVVLEGSSGGQPAGDSWV
ncbi:unnamed protein product [Darwinula stevensoni]|uniref:Catenin delta-2 n=1 Tax=Darwinula stevensoni TaxID=69355 RepID=A0A7R9A7I4_9CRUS|nr:unnamed protein product [Darwinula stevensoni]CAG0893539.1 unnamed protein product [Darwinula stevensoni]